MAELTGPQLEPLHDAIVAAFTQPQLEQLLFYKLDKEYSQIVREGANKSVAVSDIITHANSEGWLGNLLRAVGEARPSRSKLQVIVAELLPVVEDTVPSPQPETPIQAPKPVAPKMQPTVQSAPEPHPPAPAPADESRPSGASPNPSRPVAGQEPKSEVHRPNPLPGGSTASFWPGSPDLRPDPEPDTWRKWARPVAVGVVLAVVILLLWVTRPSMSEVASQIRALIAAGGLVLAWAAWQALGDL